MKVHLAPLAFCQIIVCLVGIVACVVPATLLETGFWGAWTASDGSIPGVRINSIEPDSPASQAGFESRDQLLTINGIEANFNNVDSLWAKSPVGSEVEFRVSRHVEIRGVADPVLEQKRNKEMKEKAITLTTIRSANPIAMTLYWNWQILAGLLFFALAAFTLASEPLTWLTPWRGAVIALVGLGLVVAFVVVPHRDWAYHVVQQSIILSSSTNWNPMSWQKMTTIGASVLLVILGSLDVRHFFRRIADRSRPVGDVA